MTTTNRTIALLFLAALAGCADLAIMSAGEVGCRPEDIEISNEKDGWTTRSWVATCKGKTFICSASQPDGAADVNCTEERQ